MSLSEIRDGDTMEYSGDLEDRVQFTRRYFVELAVGGVASSTVLGLGANRADALSESRVDGFLSDGHYAFQDSLGRKVPLPSQVQAIIPSGMCAQTFLYTLCPEKMISVSEINEDEKNLYRSEVANLPDTGKLYSAKEEIIDADSVETIAPGIIIDVGCYKENLTSILDALQEEAGLPVLFFDISFGNLPEAYRTAGRLLECSDRAEELASFIEELHAEIEGMRTEGIPRMKIFYAGNELGLKRQASEAVHGRIIEFLGGELVVPPVNEITGEIDMGYIREEKIDHVVFYDHDCFKNVFLRIGEASELWSSVSAIQQGSYSTSPAFFHNWFNSLIFSQTLGLIWLGTLLWPDAYKSELNTKTRDFYSLFYSHELTNIEVINLLGHRL
jgi:iron complex transport system substrate-binding protein